MTATKTFVIFRHGSNAANQSMRQVAPVFICEAVDSDAAKQAARDAGVSLYNNQYLSWKHASRCKASERQEAREYMEAHALESANFTD